MLYFYMNLHSSYILCCTYSLSIITSSLLYTPYQLLAHKHVWAGCIFPSGIKFCLINFLSFLPPPPHTHTHTHTHRDSLIVNSWHNSISVSIDLVDLFHCNNFLLSKFMHRVCQDYQAHAEYKITVSQLPRTQAFCFRFCPKLREKIRNGKPGFEANFRTINPSAAQNGLSCLNDEAASITHASSRRGHLPCLACAYSLVPPSPARAAHVPRPQEKVARRKRVAREKEGTSKLQMSGEQDNEKSEDELYKEG